MMFGLILLFRLLFLQYDVTFVTYLIKTLDIQGPLAEIA
jgi:hypothetical protein